MNLLKQKLILLFFLIAFVKPLMAQEYIVDYTYLGSRTKVELFPIFFTFVDYDIDLYKIRYKTFDIHMNPDTASGLLVLPQVPEDTQLPIVVYDHGTTSGPNDVPSQLKGGYEVAMAFGGFGFATIAPDYLGLGDARGIHPYIHAASESWASLDMLNAGIEYLEINDPDWNPNYLFVTGYSQGGHASMALHKEIQDYWSFVYPVTAATHMSGPYSISGIMRDRVLSNVSYGYPAYIAYIFLSYNEVYGLYPGIEDVFKQPFATSIQSFYDREINLTMLNSQLISALAAEGDTIVKRMLHDSIVDALANDLSHPLNEALRDNDTYNWAPVAPTRLYYCGADKQVPPRNSIIADSVMNSLGAVDLMAINLNPNFDHGPCVFPAVLNSIDFFRSIINISSVDQLNPRAEHLKVFPNPTLDFAMIDWEKANEGCDYQIINMNGETVSKGHSSSNKIPVKDLSAGVYMIICSVEDETRMARMLHR